MDLIKKYILRRILLLIFLLLCWLAAFIAGAWLLLCIVFSPNGRRGINIVLAYDQLFNAVTGGDMDETLSQRAARLRKEDVRWAKVLCKFLNWLDEGHCEKNISP